MSVSTRTQINQRVLDREFKKAKMRFIEELHQSVLAGRLSPEQAETLRSICERAMKPTNGAASLTPDASSTPMDPST